MATKKTNTKAEQVVDVVEAVEQVKEATKPDPIIEEKKAEPVKKTATKKTTSKKTEAAEKAPATKKTTATKKTEEQVNVDDFKAVEKQVGELATKFAELEVKVNMLTESVNDLPLECVKAINDAFGFDADDEDDDFLIDADDYDYDEDVSEDQLPAELEPVKEKKKLSKKQKIGLGIGAGVLVAAGVTGICIHAGKKHKAKKAAEASEGRKYIVEEVGYNE